MRAYNLSLGFGVLHSLGTVPDRKLLLRSLQKKIYIYIYIYIMLFPSQRSPRVSAHKAKRDRAGHSLGSVPVNWLPETVLNTTAQTNSID